MSKYSLMPEGMLNKLNVGGNSSSNSGGGEGEGMFGMKNLQSAGKQIASGLAGGIAEKVGGKAMGDAVRAGMATKFNPYVMAGAAILGYAKSKAEQKRRKAMGEARAEVKRAEGEQKKSDIYGQMAKSIRGSLGGAQRKRSVNL
jgi:hypothetical protein